MIIIECRRIRDSLTAPPDATIRDVYLGRRVAKGGPMTSDPNLCPGFATPEGTARFRDRFGGRLTGHFREIRGLWLSSIGLGTYLGEPDAATDALYRSAIARAIE